VEKGDEKPNIALSRGKRKRGRTYCPGTAGRKKGEGKKKDHGGSAKGSTNGVY